MFRIRQYDDYDEAVIEWRRLGLPRDFIDRRRMLGTVFAYADMIDPSEASRLQKLVKAAQGGEALICLKLGGRTLMIAAPPSFYEKVAMEPGDLGPAAEQLAAALRNFSSRYTAPWKLPAMDMRLDRTIVMGILNVTPDSFHDGGKHPDAVAHGLRMVAEGADIIDVGGESTRPGAEPTTVEDEMARVLPVIEQLVVRTSTPISVDTRHWQVAEAAAKAGAVIVNDVSGLRDAEMRRVVRDRHLAAVVMHMRGAPQDMQSDTRYQDMVGEVFAFLRQQVQTCVSDGIPAQSLVLDPGLGFSKSAEGNLELLRRLREFRSLGLPVLVGASHKAFVGRVIGDMQAPRLEGSLAAATIAVQNGASIVRAHDVRETRSAVRMADAVAGRLSP
jgi:dihydropteroate synthase